MRNRKKKAEKPPRPVREAEFCHICGYKMVGTGGAGPLGRTVEHMKPKSLGGDSHPSNLRLTHSYCNSLKGSRLFTTELVIEIREKFEAKFKHLLGILRG